MKIKEIDLSRLDESKRMNLNGSLKMNNLKDVVVLVGENGAGKTRILRSILDVEKEYKLYNSKRNDLFEEINDLENSSLLCDIDESEIKEKEIKAEWLGHLRFDDLKKNTNPNIISFIPSISKLKDWRDYPKKKWMEIAKECESLNIDTLAEGTTAFIQKLSDQAREADFYFMQRTKKIKSNEKFDFNKARGHYRKFCNLVEKNLKLKLGRNENGDAILIDKNEIENVIAEANLSEGQQLLLQICVQLYAKDIQSENYILLLDEPEVHLHPSAVIAFIEEIRKKNSNGQIWIATHSLALASHFDPDYIWYVENNDVKRAGRSTEKILNGLIGNNEDIEKLRQFTDLPYQFGATNFSAQCLLSPTVAGTGANDPQFKQIKEIFKTQQSRGEKIKVLDYGAGRGRLISAFAEDGSITNDYLDYYAYDKFDNYKDCCIDNIKKFYDGEVENRYFDDPSKCSDKSFDIVLMCNVLHEIEYKEWENTFNHIGDILRPTGFLLVVEDNRIPVGELPNKDGFLVLNTEQLNVLFEITPPLSPSNIKDAYDVIGYKEKKRLMAHLIPAKYVKNVKKETIKAAIESLKKMSNRKIKELRTYAEKGRDVYKKGMEYGFWLNQYANASLCLDDK